MYLKEQANLQEEITLKNIDSLDDIKLVPAGEDDMAVIFCNIVTTSLRPADGDVLRINLKFCLYKKDHGFSKIRKTVSFFQDPKRKLSDEESRFLDFDLDENKESNINWELVGDLFDKAGLIISHNSSFVKPWIEKYIGPRETLWGCSMQHADWSGLGFPSRGLETISVFSGFFYDFGSSLKSLDSLLFCLDKNGLVNPLIENAFEPDLHVYAANAPRDLNYLLKERRYRWNPDLGCWWLALKDRSHGELESVWLTKNLPGTEPQIFEIDPKFRFTG
jgi:hypothetical protein